MTPANTGSPRLTSPQKLLWPTAGVTKEDYWRYLRLVADRMLPHVAGRPLTLVRHPQGVEAEGFMQKNLADSAPSWLPRHQQWTPTSNRSVAYAMAQRLEDLLWMGNQNTVEFHQMLVRSDRDERPDLLAFDLDPGDPSQPVAQAALELREVLTGIGLESIVKTSGKRGLHVVVPVQRRYAANDLRAFGLAVARACADRRPDGLTVAMRKVDRGDRLLLDWSRNGSAQTLVAAWSPRATSAATVSMPLAWEEVDAALDPSSFTISTAPARPDAWATLPPPHRLERARRDLEAAGYELRDASPRSRVR